MGKYRYNRSKNLLGGGLLVLGFSSLFTLGFSNFETEAGISPTSVDLGVSVGSVILGNDIFNKCENIEKFDYNADGFVVDGIANLTSASLTYEVGINTEAAVGLGYLLNSQFTFNASLVSNVDILADATYLGEVAATGDGVSSSTQGTITYGTDVYSATIPITLTITSDYISTSRNVTFNLSFPFSGINSTVVGTTVSSLTFNLTLEAVAP